MSADARRTEIATNIVPDAPDGRAAIANYRIRRHHDDPALPSVSRRMLYESAQLHDDEEFEEGSTVRGALRGWRRTGVTLDDLWPYAVQRRS